MALEISYSPQFFDNLEGILKYFDERNGSDNFSKKLLKMIHKQIKLASAMPEIGRLTDFPVAACIDALLIDSANIVTFS